MRHQRIAAAVEIRGVKAAQRYFAQCFAYSGSGHETLWVVHLDHELRVLHVSRNPGDETSVAFPLKGILTDTIRHKSVALIMAHNHPSGDPTPSALDKQATKRLAILADALDCALLDHLILGGPDRWLSFRQMGLL